MGVWLSLRWEHPIFQVLDPDRNKVEILAELELMDSNHPESYWPHHLHTLIFVKYVDEIPVLVHGVTDSRKR